MNMKIKVPTTSNAGRRLIKAVSDRNGFETLEVLGSSFAVYQFEIRRTQGYETDFIEAQMTYLIPIDGEQSPDPAPIPMRLTCPQCSVLHVDKGEHATKPHHTHACQHCGNVWRPAIVSTVGVRVLPGFKDARP